MVLKVRDSNLECEGKKKAKATHKKGRVICVLVDVDVDLLG